MAMSYKREYPHKLEATCRGVIYRARAGWSYGEAKGRDKSRPYMFLFVMLLFLFSACGNAATPSSSSGVINVVAAENFYGDVVKQLGGSHVAVTSILSDPNVDPHEYESNVQTAEA